MRLSKTRNTRRHFRTPRRRAKKRAVQFQRDGSINRRPGLPHYSKIEKIVALLRRPDGAALGELVRTTGWQKHSIRGALSGAIKKQLGYALISLRSGVVHRYRIVSRPEKGSFDTEGQS